MSNPGSGRQALAAGAAATELALLVIGGAWLGWTLDQRLGTQPWLLIVLTLAGFAAGLFALYRATSKLQDDDDEPQNDPP